MNDGDPANFQLVITYPKNTRRRSLPPHHSSGDADGQYFVCQKGAPKSSCFTWDKKTTTATLYLAHNGQPPPDELARDGPPIRQSRDRRAAR